MSIMFVSVMTTHFHISLPAYVQVEKNIGEKRVVSFHGAGISVAPKIDFREVAGTLEDPEVSCQGNPLWFHTLIIGSFS